MSAQQHGGGGDDASDGPPAPPPGATPFHLPIKIPVWENVDQIRDHLRQQGLLHRPEDVLIIVAPDVAAELYRWAWLVGHPRCFAWMPGAMFMVPTGEPPPIFTRGMTETDAEFRARVTAGMEQVPRRVPYPLIDLIGKIDEYPVIVRGYLDPGHMGMFPYSLLAEQDKTGNAIMEAKARRPK